MTHEASNETEKAGPATQARAAADNRGGNLPAAARRALAEAEERRRAADAAEPPAREIGGRGGRDPARYGDWEIKGRAVDF